MASHVIPAPGVITVRTPPVMSLLAALDRAESVMREDARGWCADCDEEPGDSKCHTHQSQLDEADLLARLRDGITHAADSELAALMNSEEKAA